MPEKHNSNLNEIIFAVVGGGMFAHLIDSISSEWPGQINGLPGHILKSNIGTIPSVAVQILIVSFPVIIMSLFWKIWGQKLEASFIDIVFTITLASAPWSFTRFLGSILQALTRGDYLSSLLIGSTYWVVLVFLWIFR